MFQKWMVRFRDERGASLVEYALVVALIAVVCIGAVNFFGSTAAGKLNDAGGGINGESAGGCIQEGTMNSVQNPLMHRMLPDGNWTPGPCP